jgi:hypothetical protein
VLPHAPGGRDGGGQLIVHGSFSQAGGLTAALLLCIPYAVVRIPYAEGMVALA